eukprot:CAMPEP_0114580902 /NCGR_PEP_ID=MMETSP0125-20121206/5073_1 /TAXON_ID=485358 ORGANISM="Aristerostoma sp., Strain ATCC 50986" /NCGR_SAMPLE_ID=MMETSP0125 /ASSEMBLY_ACC=CAM_ASM_000245 /LENGTH=74 /DNA_ID=CAMNT_0001772699 /DNA_START=231 /DNA_END=455 /DNA_ORIENTATION=-
MKVPLELYEFHLEECNGIDPNKQQDYDKMAEAMMSGEDEWDYDEDDDEEDDEYDEEEDDEEYEEEEEDEDEDEG